MTVRVSTTDACIACPASLVCVGNMRYARVAKCSSCQRVLLLVSSPIVVPMVVVEVVEACPRRTNPLRRVLTQSEMYRGPARIMFEISWCPLCRGVVDFGKERR